jgi:hypothetical protein
LNKEYAGTDSESGGSSSAAQRASNFQLTDLGLWDEENLAAETAVFPLIFVSAEI